MNAETRDRVLDLLVDEQYARALAAGQVIRHPAGWRLACRTNTQRQADETAGWLEQQADRLLGEQKRPGAAIECPACGITFTPHDPETVRADDGLTYCRLACAAGEHGVTLDQWLAANPQAAGPGRFMRRYIEQTEHGQRLGELAPLDAPDA